MENNNLSKRIRQLQDNFLILKNQREQKIKKLDELEKEKNQTIHNIDLRVQAIDFIEKIASQERISVKERVEKLITDCLHEVYDDTYSVEFDYSVKNNKTSVEISIIRKCNDGLEIKRGIDGIGGGVADTVSLPLKLIVLLNDNEFDRVLITDEPGKHLDTTRIVKFAKFIQLISHQLNIQIIMSSHHAVMNDYADNIHKITLNDSISNAERLK